MKLFTPPIGRTQRGFTLIETLVAVLILVFAILGPFALSAQSLRASRDARNELSATYLALEGIDIVHSIRDNNSGDDLPTPHTAWMNNIISNCTNGCVPDITEQQSPNTWKTTALVPCLVVDCGTRAAVYYNPETGLYRQSSSVLTSPWGRTLFTRTLTIVGIDNAANPQRQVRITSTVTYLGYGNKTRTVSLVTDLYNWFPPLI